MELEIPDFKIDLSGLGISLPPQWQADESVVFGKPRNLRDVVPAGKGRFAPGETGVFEYLNRVRNGQRSGMQSAMSLMDSEHSQSLENPAVLCIAAGGPSLAENLGELRRLIKRGAKVLAVNKTADWLLERGIRCDYAALLDPKDWVADYINPSLKDSKAIRKMAGKHWADTKYLIASQCHEKTIDKFKSRKDAYLYHAAAGLGENSVLTSEFANEEWICITGGSVIGLRAIPLGYGMGFREFHTFGLDGSSRLPNDAELKELFAVLRTSGYLVWDAVKNLENPTRNQVLETIFTLMRHRIKFPEDANTILRKYLYSYAKPHIDNTWSAFTVDLTGGWSRSFMANHHMARSVYEFEDSLREWDKQIQAGLMEPVSIRVHGDPEQSAIAMVAAGMGIHADQIENKKYAKQPTERAA